MKHTALLVLALCLPMTGHTQTATAPNSDTTRITIRAPEAAAQEFRERMKHALAAQPEILNAILAQDFWKAGKLASDAFGAGMVKAQGKPKLTQWMPDPVKAMSGSLQKGTEEFAALSRTSGVTQNQMLQAYTENIVMRCSACHQAVRLEVSGPLSTQ